MKSFNDYLTEMNHGPGSRDLEGFRPILDSLKVQTKSIMDPEIKREIYDLVNPFYEAMAALLVSYKAKGIGYSPKHKYGGTTGVMGNPHSKF